MLSSRIVESARAARAALITGFVIATAACGDGDKLPIPDDGGLPMLNDGGPDIDATTDRDAVVEMDSQTPPMDAMLVDAIVGDGEVPIDPDSSVLRPDGGTCPAGYLAQGDVCLDINECAPGGGATCTAPENYCVNLPGGFDCTCILGRTLAGGVCVDIDECATGEAQCAPGVPCMNIDGPGRYRCGDCPAGTTGGADGSCVNVDECAIGSGCLPISLCTDAMPTASDPTTHVCTCPIGFTGNGVTVCTDVDECLTNANNCPTVGGMNTCQNTAGSFVCTCPAGFELTNAGGLMLSCIDVDECFRGTHTCDPHVACTNTVGDYSCGACPAGYATASDTRTGLCEDIDECATANFCGGNGPCLNTAGSVECLMGAPCPPGTDDTAGICVNHNECADDTDACAGTLAGRIEAECLDVTQPYKFVCSCPLGTAGLALEVSDPNFVGCYELEVDSPQLAAGYRHTCAVTATDQTLRCWGNTADRATTPATGTFTSVTNGLGFSCAIGTDKSVSCWGANSMGQAPALRRGRYEQISAGETNACGLLDDWSIRCWGGNVNNQSTPPAGPYRAIDVGPEHGCAIAFDRSVDCWGNAAGGRTTVPTFATMMDPNADNLFEQVAVGAAHSCALDQSGTIRCWGSNADGQTDVPTVQGPFIQLVAGARFTCGMRTNHTVVCWGGDDPSVGGNPTVAPGGVEFAQIAAGSAHVCGIVRSTGLYQCWGEVQNGQGAPP
ncbi:MAG: hypothetical protein ABW252_07955 [Polyangiales bacterium]